jgi:hypothetical protein
VDASRSGADANEVPDRGTDLAAVRPPGKPAPRSRLGVFFLICAALLAAWTVVLTIRLPERHVVRHWDAAWGGFDAILMVAVVTLGVMLLRRSPRAHWSAIVVSTLLFVDAWFDVTTASGRGEMGRSLLLAFVVELPLAAYCLSIAIRSDRSRSGSHPPDGPPSNPP